MFVLGTMLLAGALATAAERPNIVFILADDVGQEVLGCYGGTSYATPHLDELAKTGARFEHCYSMPMCHPSRITLLSGKYPFQLGHPQWGTFPQSAEKHTFANVLKNAGYATAVAGKWQLTREFPQNPDHPHQLGFDEYCLFGWHEGPKYHQPWIWQNGKLRDDVADRYGPDVYCDFLIDFMTRNQHRPFLAYYPMAVCHTVSNDLDPPPPVGPNGRYQSFHELVEIMDNLVGRIVATLDRLQLRQKTVILFIGDNGTMKHFYVDVENGKLIEQKIVSKRGDAEVPGGKGELTDGGTRVPMIVNWPGVVPPGRVVDDLVDFADVLPTLAELGGATLAEDWVISGRSFAPWILHQTGPHRSWVHAEHDRKHWVRTQRWKLYDDGRLIDMQHDPQEINPVDPVGQSSEAAAARTKLSAALQSLLHPGQR